MNGLYARVDPAAQEILPKDRKHHLAYRHDFTGWFMVLASVRPGVSPVGQNTEWLFIDNDGSDRFVGRGGSIIPSAGDSFRHVHRTASAEPDPAAGTAVAAVVEDDSEELPWQIIGIGAEHLLRQLRGYFTYYKHTVQQAIAGNNLPEMPEARTPDQEETALPAGFEPPLIVAAGAVGELCLDKRKRDVKAALEQAVRSNNKWAQAVVFLAVARCLRRQRRFGDAERALHTALESRPRFKEAILEQGMNRLDWERYSLAILSFEVLLRIDRDSPALLDWLVRAHAHGKRQEAARRSSEGQTALEEHETPHCVAWRQTGTCDPSGPREPRQDRPCSAEVPGDVSGFCECRGAASDGQPARAGESSCNHPPLVCADACRERWPEGTLQAVAAEQPEKPPCQLAEPPAWCSENHYAVLGVLCDLPPAGADGAESEELKRAYKRRSLQLHPDKPGGHIEAFQRVAEAHAVLADAGRRRAFDDGEDLERGTEKDGTQSPPHREVIEKKYFPERFDFQPFGDPHADRKERRELERQRLESQRQEQLALRAAQAAIKGEEL
uniref:J domain-containing protein n=1 Tax=Alexandrium monilatum TaxID=311494 RepID=A0A7S4QWP2_9DINO